MYRRSFPECPIEGETTPVPYSIWGEKGAIPKKCDGCKFEFEGECRRAEPTEIRFYSFDYGPCGIEGSSEPITIESNYITSKVKIPAKCEHCEFLEFDSVVGFVCSKDIEIWGSMKRSLDWTGWKPKEQNELYDS